MQRGARKRPPAPPGVVGFSRGGGWGAAGQDPTPRGGGAGGSTDPKMVEQNHWFCGRRRFCFKHMAGQPPPPPPCPSPGGVTWSTQIFCPSSLCRCVGDCVVRHCHSYLLYSWQDILLTEMELDSTTMFARDRRSLDIQSTVMHITAPLMSMKARQSRHCILSFCNAISVPENVRVYCGNAVPGGGGGRLATVPQGGRTSGGGGTRGGE